MALTRRPTTPQEMIQRVLAAEREGVLEVYPTLLEWLTKTEWEPGAARQTGTIMVFTEAGRWKAWLHDRDAQEGAFFTGDSMAAVLEAVEAALSTGGGDWRPDRKGPGRRG